ncbi:Rod binding protein [Poseidonocella pacifica]|uniref:Rod binding protein n=1 Tax=Poseidonocella pacifica TaxID=871651 RepID=A0A1I0XZW6_9RHOB|nr:rod-binding protein [Poseidonocella pacifica]SFB05543.1 Rod binding protein [Poseidonocella pacifica]
MTHPVGASPVIPPTPSEKSDTALRDVATKLESTFLAEMLKHAKLGESRGDFGGGVGEDQFSSFLVQAQADAMAEAGGIGLAESLFAALKERSQ